MLESAIRKEEQRVVEAMVAGDMAGMLRARARLNQLEADARCLRAAQRHAKVARGGGA